VDLDLLRRLDAYLDTAPRAWCRAETIGPFTLFVNRDGGWPYYARPTPGAAGFSSEDVDAVRGRQRALGIPEAFEWVEELTPTVNQAVAAAGLDVVQHPLMHLAPPDFRPVPEPDGARIRVVSSEDDLASAQAIAAVAFANPGTEVGPVGREALAGRAAEAAALAELRERVARGQTVTALAEIDGRPVAVGSHIPVGHATEVVGVGTLPAFRRRGLGAAVTSTLVEDALARGISDVLLSAGDEAVAPGRSTRYASGLSQTSQL